MPTLCVTYTNPQGLRIKEANERDGFTGTNAEHEEYTRQLIIKGLKRYVRESERDEDSLDFETTYQELDVT